MSMGNGAIATASGNATALRTGPHPAVLAKARPNHPERGRRSLVKVTGRALFRALKGLRAWHSRRVAVRELHALGDHALMDIGLPRSEIRSVVQAMIESGATTGGGRPC